MKDEKYFPHMCVIDTCDNVVNNDDEPWCLEHAVNGETKLPGYSAKQAAEKFDNLARRASSEHRNIFEDRNG